MPCLDNFSGFFVICNYFVDVHKYLSLAFSSVGRTPVFGTGCRTFESDKAILQTVSRVVKGNGLLIRCVFQCFGGSNPPPSTTALWASGLGHDTFTVEIPGSNPGSVNMGW